MIAAVARIGSPSNDTQRLVSAWPRLAVWACTAVTPPIPAMFEPRFYLLLQGAKRLVFGENQYDYAPGSYSVAPLGLPFYGQILEASPEKPYLGLELSLDRDLLTQIALERPDLADDTVPIWKVVQADPTLIDPLERLVRLLETPEDLPTLAPLAERELYYRLLRGPLGANLRRIVRGSGRFAQIQSAVDLIRSQPERHRPVEELAALVGMSVTSFHRHFKAATALSPLAYQQQIRLLEARRLLTGGASNVTEVAFTVGYSSPSQFSREYKRMFGLPPMHHLATTP
jgi:AraC-like DNA-binding protein